MHCKPGIFATAGTKDKRAVTVQQVTAFKVTFPHPFLPAALVLFFTALVSSSAWALSVQLWHFLLGQCLSGHTLPQMQFPALAAHYVSSSPLLQCPSSSSLHPANAAAHPCCMLWVSSPFFGLSLSKVVPSPPSALLLQPSSSLGLFFSSVCTPSSCCFKGRPFLVLPLFVFLLSCLFPVISCPSCLPPFSSSS